MVRTSNVRLLPERTPVPNGIDRKVKALPKELMPRREQPQAMPYLTPPRILSKAEKFSTDFWLRKKELDGIDAYHESLRVQLNLRESAPPLRPLDVRVVNLDQLTASRVVAGNAGISPAPPASPQQPPSPPSAGRPPSSKKDDLAQINVATREISTISTQTMVATADASTSAPRAAFRNAETMASAPRVSHSATMTDGQEATSPSPQTIVTHNYYQQTHNLNQQVHNYQQHVHNNAQYNSQHILNNNLLQQTLNQQTNNQVVNNSLSQNTLNMLHYNPTVENNLTIDAGLFASQAPDMSGRRAIAAATDGSRPAITFPNDGPLIEELPNNEVALRPEMAVEQRRAQQRRNLTRRQAAQRAIAAPRPRRRIEPASSLERRVTRRVIGPPAVRRPPRTTL